MPFPARLLLQMTEKKNMDREMNCLLQQMTLNYEGFVQGFLCLSV